MAYARSSDTHPLGEISRRMVSLHRHYFGKGPTYAKTFIQGNMVLCLLGQGETTVEQTLRAGGKGQAARRARVDLLHGNLEDAFRSAVEEATGQRVESFVAGHSDEAALTALVFLLEG